MSKPLTAKWPRNRADRLGFFIQKSVSIHVGRSRSRHRPQTYPEPTKQVGEQRPRGEAGPHNASRFLKETQGSGSRGEPSAAKPRRAERWAAPDARVSFVDPNSPPVHPDLGQGAPPAPASVSPPGAGQRREAGWCLRYFAHTPHSREFPSPPAEPGAARSPTLRGAPREGAPPPGRRSRVHLRPPPAPNVGAPRAPRPRWPSYCFTFPGVYFSLIGKKRDRGTSERGPRFPLPGRARGAPGPARGGSRARPPGSRAVPAPATALLASCPGCPAARAAAPPRAARARPGYRPRPRPSPSARPPGGQRSGRTPLGTRRLLPLPPQPHRQPRSRPSRIPAPPARPAAPGRSARGARAVAWARSSAPGPPLSPPPERLGGQLARRLAGRSRAGAPAQTHLRGGAGGRGARATRGPGAGVLVGRAALKVNQRFTRRLPGRRQEAQALPTAPQRTQKP